MNYKEATTESIPAIVEINRQIFNDMYEWPPYTLEQYTERFANILPVIYVAEEKNNIIGDVISFEKDGSWYVWILGVLEKYREKGVASRLLEWTEQYAVNKGYKKVVTKVYGVSKDMIRLLLQRGYYIVDIHKGNKVESNALILELNLAERARN